MTTYPPGASNRIIRGGRPADHGFAPNPTGVPSTAECLRLWSGSSTPPERPPSGLSKFRYWNGAQLTGSVATGFLPVLKAIDDIMRKYQYHPIESLGLWGFARRLMRGSASAWSSHSFGCAIDVNSVDNPFIKTFQTDMPVRMVNEILALRTVSGKPVVRWGGHFGNRGGRFDAMHFEVCCGPRDVATGIVMPDGSAPTTNPTPGTPAPSGDDDDMARSKYAVTSTLEAIYRHHGGVLDPGGRDYWVQESLKAADPDRIFAHVDATLASQSGRPRYFPG